MNDCDADELLGIWQTLPLHTEFPLNDMPLATLVLFCHLDIKCIEDETVPYPFLGTVFRIAACV